ncbi:MAG: DEAD/DEAH box helicase [Planctomycetaceae bacterium]|nr:DEAD/DEAH box helicase [Planctomycetaceae bacterium]
MLLKTFQDLILHYLRLPEHEQQMMRIAAVFSAPLGRHHFLLFANIKPGKTNGKPWLNNEIVESFKHLAAHELMIGTATGTIVNQHLMDYLIREVVERNELAEIKANIKKIRGNYYWGDYGLYGLCQFLESFHLGDDAAAVEKFEGVRGLEFPLLEPFDEARLAALSLPRKAIYCQHLISLVLTGRCIRFGLVPEKGLAAMRNLLRGELAAYPEPAFKASMLEWALAAGDRELLDLLDHSMDRKALDVAGCRALLDGELEMAVELLLKTFGRSAATKAVSSRGQLPALFCLLLKASGLFGPLTKEVIRAADGAVKSSSDLQYAFALLNAAFEYRKEPSALLERKIVGGVLDQRPIDGMVRAYLSSWLQLEVSPEKESECQSVLGVAQNYYRQVGCWFLASEAYNLVGQGTEPVPQVSFPGVAAQLKPRPIWEQRLQSIAALVTNDVAPTRGSGSGEEVHERLIFEIHFSESGFNLEAFQQSRKGRSWTKGRKVNLRRLLDKSGASEFAFLTDKDRSVVQTFRPTIDYRGYGVSESVEIIPEQALRGLIGHPHVYLPNDREQSLEIVEAPPRLVVEAAGSKDVRLRLDPSPSHRNLKCLVTRPSKGKLFVTFFNESILKLQSQLGSGLNLPLEAAHELPKILRPLSSLIMIHSEIDLGDGGANEGGDATLTKAEIIEGQMTPFAHLFPSGGGYFLDIFVHPFGAEGPSCRPGEGGTKLFANLGGKSLTANRDLLQEKSVANQLLEQCPNLRSWLQSQWSAMMPTPGDALEVLLELDEMVRNGHCRIMWPQGKELRLAGQVGSSNLQVRIKKDNDWFAASGTLKVDSELTVDMMRLIDLVSSTSGRFIQLDDGRFLALTEQLRRQVEEFQGFGDRRKSSSMRFPAAHAGMFENLSGVSVKADTHWNKMRERMRAAQSLDPQIPAGLLAELRDYQEDGFKWMSRLAAWGVGGCLADDMGLGKTIQALAVLLGRTNGPALVIAPTSVVFNWAAEIERFAPTLRARMVADESNGDELERLQPHDVVLCSYGLLQHRTAMLQATEWNTLILDEAQAIKNSATQRSQAAKSLKANFRMIMTGTPIENHLGELWNLFDFVNPGLLGSADIFQARFAIPIERDHCRPTKARLKKLISPFLLRRTKAQVLAELPSRTEVTLHVTMTPQETAFYEAIRRQAVEKLENLGPDHTTHLRVLAEIMRLRRACCNPQLVSRDSDIECSKTKMFLDTVQELREGGHKALVFSQFVDHLAILRRELDRLQISYQYLDGSTPANQRKKSVEAFQSGEGDLFLISLKAGGAGLNLTAADYVLHMDPWWNPAVEDQASDRAHRMGQLRPVTIYRYITEGTIEQKIQKLHGTKRDLADSLLEGTDRSGKLSADELLALLRD